MSVNQRIGWGLSLSEIQIQILASGNAIVVAACFQRTATDAINIEIGSLAIVSLFPMNSMRGSSLQIAQSI